MEPGEYGLTLGSCFVACRLEVIAVAGLLWISWCVWGAVGFISCFPLIYWFCIFKFVHTTSAWLRETQSTQRHMTAVQCTTKRQTGTVPGIICSRGMWCDITLFAFGCEVQYYSCTYYFIRTWCLFGTIVTKIMQKKKGDFFFFGPSGAGGRAEGGVVTRRCMVYGIQKSPGTSRVLLPCTYRLLLYVNSSNK